MFKAYKYRIYPTLEQAVLLNKTFGCARLVYICILADNKKQYEENGKVKQKTHTSFKAQYPFLSEVDCFALTGAYNNVKTAYNNFFRGLKNHDRDVNAAVNLRNYYTVATTGIQARGEELRPQGASWMGIFSEARKVVGDNLQAGTL